MHKGHAIDGRVRYVLSQDPIWAAYAIADLRPDLAPHCLWLVAQDASGLALLFTGLAPPILLTAGSPEGITAALTDADLPEEVFLSILPSHVPAVERSFPHIVPHDMLRMSLPPGKPVLAPAQPALRLSPVDENRLHALYRNGGDFAPDAFDRSQLDDGFFFGIEDDDGSLAAAGGTHVAFREASPQLTDDSRKTSEELDAIDEVISQGVAAIGNIYTRPDRRDLGYGKSVTASITLALKEEGYGVIVLNVSQQNLVARSIYEKLGFVTHCQFIEGFASRAMD